MKTIMILVVFWIVSCSSNTENSDEADPMQEFSGSQLFLEPHTDGNTFACNTCHALDEPSKDGVRRPGHQIGNAFKRSSFKNGKLYTLLDAVNSCRTEWMNAKPFTETQTVWVTLSSFLENASKEKKGANITFEIANTPTDLTGGNGSEGMRLFNSSCAICHGTNAVGTSRAPSIAGTSLSRDEIANRIRTSGATDSIVYDNLTGGRMPFFAVDRLSDSEILDILAYLENTEASNVNAIMTGDRVNISLDGALSSCDSDHESVGKTLTFTTRFHKVSGTATIIDNCSIQFNTFTFDGQGIDIRVYTGNRGDFSSGKTISKDLLGMPFENGSALVHLPSGVTLDDFDSLSIWCVPVGISFGDGIFQ